MAFEQPQVALEEAQQIEQRLAAARAELSEYQRQAFDAWQELGFCDPSACFVYHDGERGYHVTEYFVDDLDLLAELEQLTKKLEEARVTPDRTEAHLARTRELFTKPFQMPILGQPPKTVEFPPVQERVFEYTKEPSWRDRVLRSLFQ